MTNTLNAQHGSRIRETRQAIRDRVPFKTHGALSGDKFNGYGDTGRLNTEERNRWYADVNNVDYVVMSYSTPIAWHTDAGWYQVAQRFSVTTTRHQTQVRLAIETTI